MIAAMISIAGVAIMVGAGVGSAGLLGDFVAVLMMLGNELYMVLSRVFSKTPVVLAGAASAFQLFIIGWLFTEPHNVSLHDGILLTAFGLAFATAVILWTEGTRLIMAAESGVLGSAEVPLAILNIFPAQISKEMGEKRSSISYRDYTQDKASDHDCSRPGNDCKCAAPDRGSQWIAQRVLHRS